MTAKTTAVAKSFSPYQAACDLGAISHTNGINWSYATFESKAVCEQFDKMCNANGYRTRNKNRKIQEIGADTWYVQYHHYQD